MTRDSLFGGSTMLGLARLCLKIPCVVSPILQWACAMLGKEPLLYSFHIGSFLLGQYKGFERFG